jgi:hypothetical protein
VDVPVNKEKTNGKAPGGGSAIRLASSASPPEFFQKSFDKKTAEPINVRIVH